MDKNIESTNRSLRENAEHISFNDDGWARRRAREALRFIRGSGLRVLNAGCGPGFDSEEFKKAGHYVVGIDFDKKMVDFAKKKGFQQEGKVADLNQKLPFRAGEFDAVFCSEVVEHLPVISVFLQECRRVLRKGGLLLLTTDNPTYLKHRVRFLFGKADFLVHQCHVHLYTPAKMQELLEKNGFIVRHKKNMGNFFFVSLGDVYLVVAEKGA
ncbi:MAG: class I SAM-dependent methyltransferase [Candidatus Diapherotrites archaeon]|nr:class I SAM-dependent methyltransferase [Candidatus Diapherotrites archaeon]